MRERTLVGHVASEERSTWLLVMSDTEKAALQSYLDEHNVEGRLNEVRARRRDAAHAAACTHAAKLTLSPAPNARSCSIVSCTPHRPNHSLGWRTS